MSFSIKSASTEDGKRLFDVFVTLEKMSDSHQSAIHKFIQWYLNETSGPFTFLVKSTWDEEWHWLKITVMYGRAVIIKIKSFGKPEHSEYPTEEAFNKAINCLMEIEDAIKEHFGDDKISAPTWARESIEEFGSGPSWNDTFNGQFKKSKEEE